MWLSAGPSCISSVHSAAQLTGAVRRAWGPSSLTYGQYTASSWSGMRGELFKPFCGCVVSRISAKALSRPWFVVWPEWDSYLGNQSCLSTCHWDHNFHWRGERTVLFFLSEKQNLFCSEWNGFPPAAGTGTLTAWGWQGVVPDQEHHKLPLSLSKVQQLLMDKCFSICCWREFYFRRPEVAVFANLVQFIIVYRGEICSLPHSPYQSPVSVLSYFLNLLWSPMYDTATWHDTTL